MTDSYTLFEKRKLSARTSRTYGTIEGETLTGRELDELLASSVCLNNHSIHRQKYNTLAV